MRQPHIPMIMADRLTALALPAHQPRTGASRQYVRNHLDLNGLEAARRFPRPR